MSHLPDPPNFPIEINFTGFQHALAHGFAQRLYVGSVGVAVINEEIAMQFRKLKFADTQAPTSGSIDKFQAFGRQRWPRGFLNVLPPVRDLTAGWSRACRQSCPFAP